MSCINRYYKDFECDKRVTMLVEKIMDEYKPLLRWIKNRACKYGDDFKNDIYQITLYNLCVNTYNRVHKHNMTDEEIIGYGPSSLYKAWMDAYKNLPVNMRELREYPYYVNDDSDSDTPGTVLSPLQNDDNLERSGELSLEELINSLPCGDSTKQAILLMTKGYKQNEAAESLGIPRNTLSMRLKALRESDNFKAWAKLNNINIDSLKL